MASLVYFIDLAFDIYIGIVILQVALQWLTVFDIVNAGNAQAQNLMALLRKATDPLYKPLRKYIPPIGGIDISPIIIIIGLSLARNAIIGALL